MIFIEDGYLRGGPDPLDVRAAQWNLVLLWATITRRDEKKVDCVVLVAYNHKSPLTSSPDPFKLLVTTIMLKFGEG